MYSCKILADSKNIQGDRLTTFQITFPRIVLAEFNTHRMFSRNSASSRAIPFEKMLKHVEENPFIPIAFQKKHKGMHGSEYFRDKDDINKLRKSWIDARNLAIDAAFVLHNSGATKQLYNRLLEPFMWHTVIVTSGTKGLINFFDLRCPQYSSPIIGDDVYFWSKKEVISSESNKDKIKEFESMTDLEWLSINKGQSDIHIQKIAEMMYDAYTNSTPNLLEEGMWHLPFGDNIDLSEIERIEKKLGTKNRGEIVAKICAARCARMSYYTLGDSPKIDYEADLDLCGRLIEDGHFSPLEHVAMAIPAMEYHSFVMGEKPTLYNGKHFLYKRKQEDIHGWCRNFKGFIQYRYLID